MRKIFILLMLLAVGATTASAQKVRVMSFNVHNGGGIDGLKSFDRCADVIRKAQADVVAIQEVDSMTRRNKCYVLGEIAKEAGYHAYYGKTIPYQGGGYGIGILTKKPARSVKFYPLPCRKEPRGMLVADMGKYYFVATHLSLIREDQLASVEIIREVISKLNKPVFVAGDLNAQPKHNTMKAFTNYVKVLNDSAKPTFPADIPRICIDYILGYNATFEVLNSVVINDCLASDHLPLYVDVKIVKEKKGKK